jgi:sugar phosphate isomerase/epimerase
MAAKMGAAGVEIDARTEVRPADLPDSALRQLRKMLDDLNLRVSSVRFQTNRGYDVEADLDRRVDATKAAMELAYRLGAGVVVNQIGRVPADIADPNWQRLQSVVEDLGRYGARVGAILAAETGTEPGEDLMRLLSHNDTGFVGVALNPANWVLNALPVDTNVKAVAARVQLVVAQDAVRDLAARRGVAVPLGQGTADFPGILGLLEDRQYRGWFVIDRSEAQNPVAESLQAITYLKNL